jgi:hypothetical protein
MLACTGDEIHMGVYLSECQIPETSEIFRFSMYIGRFYRHKIRRYGYLLEFRASCTDVIQFDVEDFLTGC